MSMVDLTGAQEATPAARWPACWWRGTRAPLCCSYPFVVGHRTSLALALFPLGGTYFLPLTHLRNCHLHFLHFPHFSLSPSKMVVGPRSKASRPSSPLSVLVVKLKVVDGAAVARRDCCVGCSLGHRLFFSWSSPRSPTILGSCLVPLRFSSET